MSPLLDDWSFRTARLTIRPTQIDDAEAVHVIRGLMPFDPPTRDLPATRAMIAAMLALPRSAPGWRQFAMVADGRLIGDMGVHFDSPTVRQAELGFALHPDVRRRGFAIEGVGALVERLFAVGGLHRIAATTDARNIATQRLLTRLRFRREAHHVQSWLHAGGWSDEFSYARLAIE